LIHRRLEGLNPTPSGHDRSTGDHTPQYISSETIRHRAAVLQEDDTAFGKTLFPFFEDSDVYIEDIAEEPLFGATYQAGRWFRETTWTVIITDDNQRAEIRETVNLARRDNQHVLVFLTPRVLYEPGGLSDLDAAFKQYVKFEKFRRELNRMARVSAFEVAPGDRLDAVLNSSVDRPKSGQQDLTVSSGGA